MRRRRQRGQSIVELAVVFPLFFFVLLGVWTAAALIANQDGAAQASDYGARIAAEVGNSCGEVAGSLSCTEVSGSCQQNAEDPCAVDGEIVSSMLPALDQLSNSTPEEIWIYEPASCQPNSSGVLPSCPASTDGGPSTAVLSDNYEYCSKTSTWELQNGTGHTGTAPCWTNAGVGPYLLDDRTQTIDDEEAIGVAVSFKFTAPGLTFFSQTDSTYSDITFPPEGS
ncbi:MAG: TadE/TadG family type IV pilus assembly protein [Candidatus Dormiibacterota bacterium]